MQWLDFARYAAHLTRGHEELALAGLEWGSYQILRAGGQPGCFATKSIALPDQHIQAFKEGWGEIGGSIVVVGGDGIWNCHIHTDDIGAAIEAPLLLGGRPRQIRVTDLFEEVAEEHAAREAEPAWFQSQRMVGGVLYVDLFSGTLTGVRALSGGNRKSFM